MTKEMFVTVMAGLAAMFRVTLDDAMLEGYWMALDEIDDEEFKVATRRAMRECKFMPVPAELLAFVRIARAANAEVRAADEQIKRLHAWRDRASLAPIQDAVRELAEAKDANGRNGLK